MTDDTNTCPKCGGEFENGFLLDRASEGRALPLLWSEPKGLGLGGIRVKGGDPAHVEVDAYRCLSCGYLELYAGLGE